jgi:hypothetical protein
VLTNIAVLNGVEEVIRNPAWCWLVTGISTACELLSGALLKKRQPD